MRERLGLVLLLGMFGVSVLLIASLVGCFYLGCVTVMGVDDVDHNKCADDGEVIIYTVAYFSVMLCVIASTIITAIMIFIFRAMNTSQRYQSV